ncbi:MAG: hypothetical protein ACXW16_04730 [Burkholderiaceae bacterium]
MTAFIEIPRFIFLFSGHMIDKPDRKLPRFPPECEPSIAAAIDATLTELGAGPADLGITQGACGGDLLFAEAMLKRGAALELHLPLPEETFVVKSVDFTKASSAVPDRWRERFYAVRQHRSVRTKVMPAESESDESDGVFERCNLWMLEHALSFGADKVRFICVWNGDGGDGPGGTDHMREAVQESGGAECWIDTRKLCQQR